MEWSRFFRRKQWDQERAEEVEAYVQFETADNVARGMPAAEARSAARRKLGNPALIREEIYRMNTIGFMETFWRDLCYTVRVLRKSPGYALIAVLSLALGIGANTSIFSLVDQVMLRMLPVGDPARLVVLHRRHRRRNRHGQLRIGVLVSDVSPPTRRWPRIQRRDRARGGGCDDSVPR
jgi:hypothetical protein